MLLGCFHQRGGHSPWVKAGGDEGRGSHQERWVQHAPSGSDQRLPAGPERSKQRPSASTERRRSFRAGIWDSPPDGGALLADSQRLCPLWRGRGLLRGSPLNHTGGVWTSRVEQQRSLGVKSDSRLYLPGCAWRVFVLKAGLGSAFLSRG